MRILPTSRASAPSEWLPRLWYNWLNHRQIEEQGDAVGRRLRSVDIASVKVVWEHWADVLVRGVADSGHDLGWASGSMLTPDPSVVEGKNATSYPRDTAGKSLSLVGTAVEMSRLLEPLEGLVAMMVQALSYLDQVQTGNSHRLQSRLEQRLATL